MTDRDDDRKRNRASDLLPLDVPVSTEGHLPGHDALADVADELGTMLDGARPDPDGIEDALDGIDLPGAGTLDVETEVLPEAVSVDPTDADVVLDTSGDVVNAAVARSGEAVEIAVDGSGEAATVVVDAGGEAIEVVAENGGEVAAEVVVEVVAAALEGA